MILPLQIIGKRLDERGVGVIISGAAKLC